MNQDAVEPASAAIPAGPLALEELKRQLAQVGSLEQAGVLSAASAQEARAKIERSIIDLVTSDGTAFAALSASPGVPPLSAHAAVPTRPSRRLVLAVTAFVLAFGAAGYAWLGNHDGLRVGPGDAVGDGGHGTGDEQIEGMTAKLVERLKAQPDDAEGWAMLGRTYTALNRHPDALAAYKKVVELRPQDAQALADLADGLAVMNNRSLAGEPERLIAQAVKLDPKNVKALALAGTVAFTHDDYKAAAGYWQKAVELGDPTSEFTKQLESSTAEARQRAGLPAAPASVAASATAAGGAAVSGRVSVAPALQARVGPDDTLFVFARAVTGQKMPLAILRRPASELPLSFTLDDSMAMSPAARLSSSRQVVIGARISKSGNAMAQPGDLQGLSAPVAVGARGLQIEIGETVK